MNVTITNNMGDRERVSLPSVAEYDDECTRGRTENWTGCWITGLWTGPRSGRHIGRSYSIWGDRQGIGIIGTTYRELDESEYLEWCAQLGIEPQKVEVTEL